MFAESSGSMSFWCMGLNQRIRGMEAELVLFESTREQNAAQTAEIEALRRQVDAALKRASDAESRPVGNGQVIVTLNGEEVTRVRGFAAAVKPGAPMVAAAIEYYHDQPELRSRFEELMSELVDEYGDQATHFANAAGSHVLENIRAEEQRLKEGWTHEPPTFYEENAAWLAMEQQTLTER